MKYSYFRLKELTKAKKKVFMLALVFVLIPNLAFANTEPFEFILAFFSVYVISFFVITTLTGLFFSALYYRIIKKNKINYKKLSLVHPFFLFCVNLLFFFAFTVDSFKHSEDTIIEYDTIIFIFIVAIYFGLLSHKIMKFSEVSLRKFLLYYCLTFFPVAALCITIFYNFVF